MPGGRAGSSWLRTGRRLARLAIAPALALVVIACGGEQAGPSAAGELRAGSVATLADCGDWREAGVDERLATIAHVRSRASPDGGPVEDPVLSDEDAYELFERACAPAYASSFRLYKLYPRGASFNRLGK